MVSHVIEVNGYSLLRKKIDTFHTNLRIFDLISLGYLVSQDNFVDATLLVRFISLSRDDLIKRYLVMAVVI